MAQVKVEDPFKNLTQAEIQEYVKKQMGFDPTTIKKKDPMRHYRLAYREPGNIQKLKEQGYVVMDQGLSKGEELLGASLEKPFECGDCLLVFTDRRIHEAVVKNRREENERMLGSHKREAIREIREAEKEAGISPGRLEIVDESGKSGEKTRVIDPDDA